MTSTPAIWLGRVTRPGDPIEHTIRIRSAGQPPGPADAIEEIEDPFTATRPWNGGRTDFDLHARISDAPPVRDGLSGKLSQFAIAPPVRPGKILCVGRNFRAHAAELGNEVPKDPLLFFKPPTCVLGSGETVPLPAGFERIDLEGELVVVIGERAKNLDRERALSCVLGYTVGNDVSNRDLQKRDGQWTRAKGFDGFGPFGPFVRLQPPGQPLPGDLRVRSFLDDAPCQDAPLSDMVFDVPTILATISACMTLEPGDLIFMGTPEGVAALSPGRVARVEIDGLGRLTNPIGRA